MGKNKEYGITKERQIEEDFTELKYLPRDDMRSLSE